jgi:hypothetical protein
MVEIFDEFSRLRWIIKNLSGQGACVMKLSISVIYPGKTPFRVAAPFGVKFTCLTLLSPLFDSM